MTLDTAMALAAIALVLLWPLHQELTIRALRHALRRQRDQLAQHRRAIVHLQGAAVQPPTSIGQPMPTVGRTPVTLDITRVASGRPTPVCASDIGWSPDETLRLQRPPALSDLQHVLTQAGRALTATEMATQLGRQPWDLIADIDRDTKDGRIKAVPGHTAGRTAYTLADPTMRMAKMPVLPGLVQ